MLSLAHHAGQQQALFLLGLDKLAAYSPEQLNLMQQHWGVTDPAQMLEMNRARALAPQGPAAAKATQTWNASRARAGLGPMTSQPVSGLGWQPGVQNPTSIPAARQEFMSRFMEGPGGAGGPAPRPMSEAEWAGRRANIPAAKPSADLGRMARIPGTLEDTMPAGMRAGTATVRDVAGGATQAGMRRTGAGLGFAKTMLKSIR